MQKSKNGHGCNDKSEGKEKKYRSAYFSCLFHILKFKILPLTVLDRMQSVTDGRMDGRIERPKPICPHNFCNVGGCRNK